MEGYRLGLGDAPSAGGGGGQASIQFKDEGVAVGGLGLITSIDFVGAGVTATVVGAALTLTISGGGGGSTPTGTGFVHVTAGVQDGAAQLVSNADVAGGAAIALSKLSGVAASGANADITSLSGLLTPLSIGQGGTGAATASAARTALGVAQAPTRIITFVVDGAGSALSSGYKGNVQIPYSGTIVSVTVLGKNGETGSVVVDLWKDTYANFPPTVADTITAAAKPTISSGTKYTDATLTGWSPSIAAGDVIGLNLDSVSGFTQLTVQVKVTTG